MFQRIFVLACGLAVCSSAAFAQPRSNNRATPTPHPAHSLAPAALVRLPALQPQAPSAEWQRQMADARAKKSSGKKKVWIGGAAFGLGAIVTFSTGTGDSPSTGGVVAGNLIMLGGAVTSVWGFVQSHQASGRIDRLEEQRASGGSALTVPLGNQALRLQVGHTRSLTYHVTW